MKTQYHLNANSAGVSSPQSKEAFASTGLQWSAVQPLFSRLMARGTEILVIILGGRKALEPLLRRTGVSREVATFWAAFASSFAGMTYWHSSHPRKRTVDLTLAALVRGIDVVVQSLWRGRQSTTRVERVVKKEADTIVFAVSCTIIMFAWFYKPERLPKYFSSFLE